jgi:predicted NAD/FAD-binding protein
VANNQSSYSKPLNIAVIGTGISGMAAAWLLDKTHNITVYEQNNYVGGHSNTVSANIDNAIIPVDTGFIVYNEKNYPNLTALFKLLKVPTTDSEMSFSASLEDGSFEYSGTNLNGLIGQRRNIFRPRFWRMLRDINRFYKEAPSLLKTNADTALTLDQFLKTNQYCDSFINDHLMPMGAAIWSTNVNDMKNYPAVAFTRFFESHGLLNIKNRPKWKTVNGGSKEYVEKLTEHYKKKIRFEKATSIERMPEGVKIESANNGVHFYDHVVIATHADEAFSILKDPSESEIKLLSKWRYSKNKSILHKDSRFMPKRKRVWSSWNFIENHQTGSNQKICLTYWMNKLQNIETSTPLFVTLNPTIEMDPHSVISEHEYTHPYFDAQALKNQKNLWDIQGIKKTWFCGSYFGYGFHEDGLQSGLAVAEELGGMKRPWDVSSKSSRITVPISSWITE